MRLRDFLKLEMTPAVWAVCDQAVVSLASFVLTLGLARYAPPAVYGQFVIVISLMLLVYACLQAPLCLDPLVFLGGKRRDGSDQLVYVRRVLGLHLLISLGSMAALIISWVLLTRGFPGNAYARAALLACAPVFFMNLRYFIRACYFMKGSFSGAFLNDAIVLAGVVVGLAILIPTGRIADWTAVLVLTVSEAGALFLLVFRHPRRIWQGMSGLVIDLRKQPIWGWSEVRETCHYGKWLMLAGSTNFAQQRLQFLLLPAFVSLESLAGYHACFLVVQPIYHFATGMEFYSWNRSVQRLKTHGVRALRTFLVRLTVMISVWTVLYGVIVGWNLQWVLRTLYSGRFLEYSGLFWLFAFATIPAFCSKMIGAGLRALGTTGAIFAGAMASGLFGVVCLLSLSWRWGVVGTAWSYVLTSWASVAFLAYFGRKSLAARASNKGVEAWPEVGGAEL